MSTEVPSPTSSPSTLPPTVHEGVTFEIGDRSVSGVVIERIFDPRVNDLDRMILRVQTDAGVHRVRRRDVR